MINLLKQLLLSRKKSNFNYTFLDATFEHAGNPAHRRNHVQRTVRSIRSLIAGENSNVVDLFVSAPTGFPEVHGVPLHATELAKSGVKSDSLAKIDLYFDSDDEVSLHISAGATQTTLQVVRRGNAYTLTGPGDTRKVKAGNFLSISLFRPPNSNSCHLYARSQSKELLKDHIAADGSNLDLSIVLASGGSKVMWLQSAAFDGELSEYASAESHPSAQPTVSSSPKVLRDWEERARRIWHLAILIRVSVEAINRDHELVQDTTLVRQELLSFALTLCHALHGYPNWRPAQASAPTDGPWERGNWSNGFLLGAFGVLAGMCWKELNPKVRRQTAKIAKRKGIDWLAAPRGNYTKLDFPSLAHWKKRSTNHGIVILASACVGTIELQSIFGSKYCAGEQKYLESTLWELTESAFAGGVYLEGLKYAQFSLQEFIVFAIYALRKSGLSWEEFEEKKLAFLRPFVSTVFLSGIRNRNRPVANWGDSPDSPWKQSVIRFLTSLNSPHAPLLDQWLVEPNLVDGELNLAKGEVVKSEPILAAASELPALQSARNIPSTLMMESPRAQMAGYFRDCDDGSYQIWVVGAERHLTHNKDHDLGSFFLCYRDEFLVGESPGREAHRHSTILCDDTDPRNFPGPEKDGHTLERTYIGSVTTLDCDAFHQISVVNKGAYTREGTDQIESFQRHFYLPKQLSGVCIVETRVVSKPHNQVFANYVIPEVEVAPLGNSAFQLGNASRITFFGQKGCQIIESNDKNPTRILQQVDSAGRQPSFAVICMGDTATSSDQFDFSATEDGLWHLKLNGSTVSNQQANHFV